MNDTRTIIVSPRPKLVFTGDSTVQLLEIELRLTRGEYALLRLISDSAPQSVTASDAGLSPAAMAAMICNINKKATIISGRNLIVSCRGHGYRLTEHP